MSGGVAHVAARRTAGLALLMLATLMAIAGCNGTRNATATGDRIEWGQTLSLTELTEQVNQNNQAITSLWASGYFEARLREKLEDPPPLPIVGDLTMMYLADDRLLIKARKPGVDVFELGSDGESFWLVLPTESTLFIGTFAGLNPGKLAQMPVRPDLVLEVLGVKPLPEDLLATPVPMLRYNPDSTAYMLTFAEPVAEGQNPRWQVVKEVWYDRATLLPTNIILFDPDGRPVLRAYLSRHERIDVSDGPAPTTATRYDLYFPQTGSTMQIDLSKELHLKRRGFPKEQSFRVPDRRGFERVEDLDEAQRR